MPLYIKDIGRARQAAKSLKLNLDFWNINRPLTWHQDTLAKMLEHQNWKALVASISSGSIPSLMDEEVGHSELMRRRAYQAQVLLERVGAEAIKTCGGTHVFETIARYVAPSGQPNAGTAFKTMTVEIDENGFSLPLSLDFWTEDALFIWKDLPVLKGYEHVAERYDPEAEEFYALLLGETVDVKTARRIRRFCARGPADDLDKLALLSQISREAGSLDVAAKIIGDAYNIGSYAWAPIARKRRRLHNPIRWWEELNTRPFMRVLHEKAMVDLSLGTEYGFDSGIRMLQVILALNPSDPLNVREMFTVIESMADAD